MKRLAFIDQFQEWSSGNISAAVGTLTETREETDQYPDNIELRFKRSQLKSANPTNFCFLQIFKEILPEPNSIPNNSTDTKTRGHGDKDQYFAPLELTTKTATGAREEEEQKCPSFFAIPRN